MIKTLTFYLPLILIFTLNKPLLSQENVSNNSINSDRLNDRVDSLTMVVDSMLMDKYNIDTTTNKEGLVVHRAVGVLASSLGIGLQFVLSAHEKVNIRLSASYFTHSATETIYDESIGANITHEVIKGAAYLLVDYQFHKLFHATAGVLYAVDEQNGDAHAASGITIGGVDIPADIVGQISYAAENNGIAPYVGLGFGRSISIEKKISFTADLGLYYLDKKNIELDADGMLEPTALQKSTLEENAGTPKFFFYFGVQLSYRLF